MTGGVLVEIAVLTFVAYALGALLVEPITTLAFNRVVRHGWAIIRYGTDEERADVSVGRGQLYGEHVHEGLPLNEWPRKPSFALRWLVKACQICVSRAADELGELRANIDRTMHLYRQSGSTQQGAQKLLRELDVRLTYQAEHAWLQMPQTADKLLLRAPSLYDSIDRNKSEGDFRLAIGVPLVAIAVLLAATLNWLWATALLPGALLIGVALRLYSDYCERVMLAWQAGEVRPPYYQRIADRLEALKPPAVAE